MVNQSPHANPCDTPPVLGYLFLSYSFGTLVMPTNRGHAANNWRTTMKKELNAALIRALALQLRAALLRQMEAIETFSLEN